MKIQVMLCNDSGNAMMTNSARFTKFLQMNTDVKDICSDGVRLHSSVSNVIDIVCDLLSSYKLAFRRIDNCNVRVAMKESGNGFGVYFA